MATVEMNENLPIENVPADIMLQVNALFRSLDTLPKNTKTAVLSKIQSQLGKNVTKKCLKGTKTETSQNCKKPPKTRLKGIKQKTKPQSVQPSSRDAAPPSKDNGYLADSNIIKPCSIKIERIDLNECDTSVKKLGRARVKRTPRRAKPISEDSGCDIFDEVEIEYNYDDADSTNDPDFYEASPPLELQLIESDSASDEWSVDDPDDPETKKRGKRKKDKDGEASQPMCSICGKFFTQRSGLYVHMKRHRGEKPYECALCDYSSVAKRDVIRHMPTHTGTKNYTCEYCGKLFATEHRVKTHVDNVHERKKQDICHICGFVTHSRDIMRRHSIVKHTQLEQFECPICHEIIKQKGTFQIHMRRHTGLRPYSCPVCDKTFKSRSQVAAHKRSHSDGRFPCPECGHLFKTKSHLKRHSVVHTGAKPFSCEFCDYTCNVKGNITKHVRSVHHIANYTLRDMPVKAIDGQTDRDAQEKGYTIAQQSLEEVSKKTGTEITLDDLKCANEEVERQKERSENVPKKKYKSGTKKVTLISVKEAVESLREHTDSSETLENEEAQTDVLSDAVHLLNPESAVNTILVEEDAMNAAEIELLPQSVEISSDCTTVEVPLASSGENGQPINMYLLHVIPNAAECNEFL